MTNKVYIFIFSLLLFSKNIISQNTENSFTYNYSLKELSELKIITGSIKEEKRKSAPSNITIITSQMIEERGYKTLVDICQDIPGFDFMMYNDGGGEYPTFNMNRGMGDVGNPEILVMVDGIIQNSISFNWSMLWTYENMLIDIDRIEIIQGPGSVMYGAQAFSGIIHIITKKKFNGIHANAWYGSYATRSLELYAGTKLSTNTNFSIAVHNYSSDGDNGIDRYDPGTYFKDNQYPSIIIHDYNANGEYISHINNSKGGTWIKDGFNTQTHNFAVRSKLNYKNTEFGFYFTDYIRPYGSAVVAYEYDLTDKENTNHYRNYHAYASNKTELNNKLTLQSDLVYRVTNIIPDGGFKYLYQFPDLRKSYAGYSNQTYLEEKLLFNINSKNDLSFGFKASINNANNRTVSLGEYSTKKYSTDWSWDIAYDGGGLNRTKDYPNYWVKEIAVYALWDYQLNEHLSSSAGIRYDYNSDYGSILNPRFALDFNPSPIWGAKFMYGRAFRQPSIFELFSEFRGNPNLGPQNINTAELELTSLLLNDQLSIKFNFYYSIINNLIGKVDDNTMPAGERYENIGKKEIGGFSAFAYYQLSKAIRLYSNYNFITGINNTNKTYYDIDRTAKHKINAGCNIKLFNTKLTSDFRINYVSKRKAPETNMWIQLYEDGYAPSYTKANWVISYQIVPELMGQLSFNNLFNTQYYGVGHESGSGFIDEYNYQNNVNPDGIIPAYHPQPGRTISLGIVYKLNH
nr:TonB-dependent receptor [uncultured Carboxylicivirga sp.]